MRFVVALMILMISAPMLAHERLSADDVARFLDTAEQIMATTDTGAAGGSGLPLPAREILSHPSRQALVVLAQHGYSRGDWLRLTQRVMSARQVTHMIAAAAAADEDARAEAARKLAPGSGLTGFDRVEMTTLVRWTQSDSAALERETRADRAVIAPFMDRLDRLDGGRAAPTA